MKRKGWEQQEAGRRYRRIVLGLVLEIWEANCLWWGCINNGGSKSARTADLAAQKVEQKAAALFAKAAAVLAADSGRLP